MPGPRRKHRPSAAPEPSDRGIRLNKYIANAGLCSRRKADEFIKEGRVAVNEEIILEVGVRIDKRDRVTFDGKRVEPGKKVYILLNKPKDVISTTDDDRGRRTIMDLIHRATDERVYPVGRLDRNTTGLLLITNDGQLSQKLTHPSGKVKKLYKVELNRPLTKAHLQQVADGVTLEEGVAIVDDVAYADASRKVIGIEVHIGWNRVIRRIFEALGYEVQRLDRVMFAGLTKKDLPRGKWRYLTDKELVQLKHFM